MSDLRSRRAPDLEPDEQGVADWFQSLDRHDAPSGMRARVLEPRSQPAGRLLRMVPFGAWGIASAALVLVAVGAAVTVELTNPVTAPVHAYETGTTLERDSLIVRTDPAMGDYHKFEIFDEVGLPTGEVIAGWGR